MQLHELNWVQADIWDEQGVGLMATHVARLGEIHVYRHVKTDLYVVVDYSRRYDSVKGIGALEAQMILLELLKGDNDG